MVTSWAKIPYQKIVSELDFFKSKITNYASLVSSRKSSFEGLNFKEITPSISLEEGIGVMVFPRRSVQKGYVH